MNERRPWLLIPIETKVREYHSKLLLGAFAVSRGFNVILGEQQELKRKLEYLPRGVMLEKGITPHQATDMRRSRALGHRLVAWCEEGLVYRNKEAYLRDRIHLPGMEMVDRFFAWGDRQAEDVLSKTTDAADKLVRSGNPRFDLLRPELRGLFQADVDRIREQYGRYVLVATNFGRVNHFRGDDFVSNLLDARGARATPEIAAFTEEWTRFLSQIYRSFLESIPRLAKSMPHTSIIVRPHPSEDRESWRRALSDCANVEVVHEGSVVPWILGSDVLVHNSCTTGVEAYLLDVPVIAYRPSTSEMLDSRLPNAVSHPAYTLDELVELVRMLTNGEAIPGFTADEVARRKATLESYVEGFRGPLASERIVNALTDVPLEAQSLDQSGLKRWSMMKTDVVSSLRSSAAAAAGRVVVGRAYQRHKFPGLGIEELRSSLAELSRYTERLRGIEPISIRGMTNVACLSRDDSGSEAALQGARWQ